MINRQKDDEPLLRELEKLRKIIGEYQQRETELVQAYERMKEEAEGFREILKQLPLQLQVYGPDGVSLLVSQALLDEFKFIAADQIIGHYNILEDPAIKEIGKMEYVKRVFSGETFNFSDLDAPLKQLEELYHVKFDEIMSVYQNALLLPVFNQEGEVIKVVALLNTERTYKVKDNINRALRFLKENYQSDYNLKLAAEAAGLSPYHFTRLFKAEVGETPKKHFTNLKINMVKEKLADRNLSVSQVFSECGLDYNGYYAKLFKKIVGVTPSQFRKLSGKSNVLPKHRNGVAE